MSKIGGLITDGIKKSLEFRETQLLDNDMLFAAIYADPNYSNAIRGLANQKKGSTTWFITKEKEAGYAASPQIDTSPATSSSEFDDDDIENGLITKKK